MGPPSVANLEGMVQPPLGKPTIRVTLPIPQAEVKPAQSDDIRTPVSGRNSQLSSFQRQKAFAPTADELAANPEAPRVTNIMGGSRFLFE